MKTILLHFYNNKNFGDDLFALLFAESFYKENKIMLLGNPYIGLPEAMKGKAKYCPQSYFLSLLAFIQCRVKSRKLTKAINKWQTRIQNKLVSKADAFVRIGGSIFMDKNDGNPEIPFSVPPSVSRDFTVKRTFIGSSNVFIIGANLGPVFHESYFSAIRNQFLSYKHISIRDYSSYSLVKDLPNVQYAPDLGFAAALSTKQEEKGRLVISVVKIENHTKDAALVDRYYSLICSAMKRWKALYGKITLLSLCRKEGDDQAISKIKEMLSGSCSFDELSYNGETETVIDTIASAEYLICSRFHSMIIGFANGKRLFPIAYNCKTENYLFDLAYQGCYATMQNLMNISVQDVFSNYENNVQCNCSLHTQYAKNQFYGLSEYLKRGTADGH